MRAALTRVVACALVLWVAGCSADLGPLAGLQTLHSHKNFVASGRLTAATRIASATPEQGWLVGLAIESRSEAHVGSRWEAGLMFGYGSGPAAIGGRCGWELYGELGTPLRSTLFAQGDIYTGLTVGVPLFFGVARRIADLNRSASVVSWRTEFVPTLRTRLHYDAKPTVTDPATLDVAFGVMLRFHGFSDVF